MSHIGVEQAASVAAGLHLAEGQLAVHALVALEAVARVVVARRGVCAQGAVRVWMPGCGVWGVRGRGRALTGRQVAAEGAAGGAGGVRAAALAGLGAARAAPLRAALAREGAGQVAARAAVLARRGRALVHVLRAPAAHAHVGHTPHTPHTRTYRSAPHGAYSQLALEALGAEAGVGGHAVLARGAVLTLVRLALVHVDLTQTLHI